MIKFTDRYVSKIAIAVVIGGISLAHSVYAADTTDDSADQQSGGTMMKHEGHMSRVDDRIKELHETLDVTPAQEPKWRKVSQVMRQNEKSIHKLVEARHEKENATAVEDLKSYERIAYAHDQGLRKLIPAFETFYKSLTPDQKSNADNMFGKYEGRVGDKGGEDNSASDNARDTSAETANENRSKDQNQSR